MPVRDRPLIGGRASDTSPTRPGTRRLRLELESNRDHDCRAVTVTRDCAGGIASAGSLSGRSGRVPAGAAVQVRRPPGHGPQASESGTHEPPRPAQPETPQPGCWTYSVLLQCHCRAAATGGTPRRWSPLTAVAASGPGPSRAQPQAPSRCPSHGPSPTAAGAAVRRVAGQGHYPASRSHRLRHRRDPGPVRPSH